MMRFTKVINIAFFLCQNSACGSSKYILVEQIIVYQDDQLIERNRKNDRMFDILPVFLWPV